MDSKPEEDPCEVKHTALHGWTPEHVKVLREWKRQIAMNLYLQIGSSYYYQWIYNALTIPNIVLGGALSVTIFTELDNTIGLRFTMGVLAMLSTILTTSMRHIGAAEKAQEYRLASRSYQSLLRSINMTLTLNPAQRPNADEYLTLVRKEIDRITNMQCDPVIHVLKQFDRRFSHTFDHIMWKELESDTTSSTVEDPSPVPSASMEMMNDIENPQPQPQPPISPLEKQQEQQQTPNIDIRFGSIMTSGKYPSEQTSSLGRNMVSFKNLSQLYPGCDPITTWSNSYDIIQVCSTNSNVTGPSSP
jgi:hypothetical protein